MFHREGACHARQRDSQPYHVGLQVSCSVSPEVPSEGAVPRIAGPSRGGLALVAGAKESRLERGHLMADPVPLLLSIPPKYSVAQVVGFIKGKAAIHIARTFMGRRKNYTGHHFWARGYYVSTVGRDEAVIREYIRTQEAEDRRLDQMDLWEEGP